MKLKELKEAVGSLSAPSKMPCSGYSIPAKRMQCEVDWLPSREVRVAVAML